MVGNLSGKYARACFSPQSAFYLRSGPGTIGLLDKWKFYTVKNVNIETASE